MKVSAEKYLESLQNAANSVKLSGLQVYHRHFEDRRKQTPMFYLCLNGATISPVLDYQNLNHFILGFSKAVNLYSIVVKS